MSHLPFLAAVTALLAAALLPLVQPLLRAEPGDLPGSAHRLTAWWLVAGLPALAAALYLATGTPGALQRPSAPAAPSVDVAADGAPPSSERIQAMVDRLAAKLQADPADAAGWRMLARSYEALGRPADAVAAYRALQRLTPDDTGMLLDYAVTLAMSQGRTLSGAPLALIRQVLAREPDNLQAHALAGSEAYERGDAATAVEHWQAVLDRVPPGSETAATVQASIDRAKALARR